MKRIVTLMGIITLLFIFSIDSAYASNESEARAYCNQKAKDGVPCKVSKWVGCGKGWTKAKRFGGRGKDWFACKKTAFAKGSEKNKKDCEAWCKKNNDCEKCAKWSGCGTGYKKLNSFRSKGKDWFACQKTTYAKVSEKNKKKCEAWCKNSKDCKRCANWSGCGVGYKKLKTFKGSGKDWYACQETDLAKAGDKNKAQCKKWCADDRDCEKCSKLPGCGYGFKKAKKFGGKGKNWYACQKRGFASVNAVWPSNSAAKRSHRALVVSLGGAFGRFGRDGIEWFARDYLGDYKNQILYVGSYGSIWTISEKLAGNIKSLARAIEKKSGKKPKVILIGKSMGGCKEHHATHKMGNFPIDLFVSVDMCCGRSCYAKKGDKGAKKYKRNVKKFINFYQAKNGESMCGHQIAYEGQRPNPMLNINVNKDGFDSVKWVKVNGRKLCNNVGHKGDNGIDKCKGLKNQIKKIVLNEVGIGGAKKKSSKHTLKPKKKTLKPKN